MNKELTEQAFETDTRPEVYSVSRLNNEVRDILEGHFTSIWVEGELSNLARPTSGHIYFSLKDEAAQVSCAMFRTQKSRINFIPENGLQVLVRARASLYPARGNYQLIVEHMEEAGDGALRRAFEELKQRLSAEGLFDEEHKQKIPDLPKRIGVITSPSGAAIRDILSVLNRRFPSIPVLIYPVPVQGTSAGVEIVSAIQLADKQHECDTLILARGGGSLEDLWAFNEEVVARAIFSCSIPIITGIGHEIDFTIADFVADLRAPTPSGAAELASPDQAEWLQTLITYENQLSSLQKSFISNKLQTLQWLNKHLQQQHPGQKLRQQNQRLDELEQRLSRSSHSLLRHKRSHLAELYANLRRHVPLHQIEQQQTQCGHLSQRLKSALTQLINKQHQQLSSLSRALDAVSPLATLGRGYAITRSVPDGKLIHAYSDAKKGDMIETQLAKGRLISEIKTTHEK